MSVKDLPEPTYTGRRIDLDYCQRCGTAFSTFYSGWFIDTIDVGADAEGDNARLFREDVEPSGDWEGFKEEDIGPWCDSCSWVLQRKRTADPLVADGGTSTRDSERHRLVEIMALLDEADRKFNGLGGRQAMSVGPVLSDVAALREELTERGKNYGLLPESASVDELRNEAYRCVNIEARYSDADNQR